MSVVLYNKHNKRYIAGRQDNQFVYRTGKEDVLEGAVEFDNVIDACLYTKGMDEDMSSIVAREKGSIATLASFKTIKDSEKPKRDKALQNAIDYIDELSKERKCNIDIRYSNINGIQSVDIKVYAAGGI